ncbi:hypothetical protein PCANB_002515 [Pneumocystis canis]|nr:hypothetical protein PCANB_002515 [Pneumocystis canis]
MNMDYFIILKNQDISYKPYYVPSEFSYMINDEMKQDITPIQKMTKEKNWTESRYLNYFSFENNKEILKTIIRNAFLRYFCIFIVQPFEISKTILQCQYHAKPKFQEDIENFEESLNDEISEESEEDNSIISNESDSFYFYEPDSPVMPSNLPCFSKKSIVDRQGYVLALPNNQEILFPWQINIQKTTIKAVISALLDKEGFWRLWKETVNFDYWIGSFFISLTSSAFTSLLLAPIDIAKTRIMMTPRQSKSHEFSSTNLSFYICPTTLILPTFLYSTLPNIASFITTILFKKCNLMINSYETPIMHNFISLVAALTNLCIKLPLETILRRAQLHISNVKRTLVKPGRYVGISGTIWCILNEENNISSGLDGFYYGWRISLCSLLGVWTLGLSSFIPFGFSSDFSIIPYE